MDSISNKIYDTFTSFGNKIGALFRSIHPKEEKVANYVYAQLGVEVLAQGKEKKVWKVSSQTIGRPSTQHVFYTPTSPSREAALRQEAEKMKAIGQLVGQEGQKHLALEAEELTGINRINGKYTLKVPEAIDFEQVLRRTVTENAEMPVLSTAERIQLGGHLLKGLSTLHGAGYTYGDMKPENCLVYEQDGAKTLKLADFGHTQKVAEDEYKMYKGNLRFCPPEGKLSQKGDVYSAALMLIRNLEEPFLKPEGAPLRSIDKQLLDYFPITAPADRKRFRGIERFVIDHRAFPAPNPSSLAQRLFRHAQVAASFTYNHTQQRQELGEYIDALKLELIISGQLNKEQASNLGVLLKGMTATNPNDRPSAELALAAYNNIFKSS